MFETMTANETAFAIKVAKELEKLGWTITDGSCEKNMFCLWVSAQGATDQFFYCKPTTWKKELDDFGGPEEYPAAIEYDVEPVVEIPRGELVLAVASEPDCEQCDGYGNCDDPLCKQCVINHFCNYMEWFDEEDLCVDQRGLDEDAYAEYMAETVKEVVSMESQIVTAEAKDAVIAEFHSRNDLIFLSMSELKAVAKKMGLRGYSKLDKMTLCNAIAAYANLPIETVVKEEVPVEETKVTPIAAPAKAEMPKVDVVHTHDSPTDFYAGLRAMAGMRHAQIWRHSATKTILVAPDFKFEFEAEGKQPFQVSSFEPLKWLGRGINWAVRIVSATTVPTPENLG